MKKFIVIAAGLFYVCMGFAQGEPQPGYEIKAELKPFKNCTIYLGTYYSKNKILADSAVLDENSNGIFKGAKKLPGGIYFFISPSRTLLFEILLDENQHFSVYADSANMENLRTEGSPDNELFASYSRYLTTTVPKINALQQQFKTEAKNKADSASIQQQLKATDVEINAFRDKLAADNPNSMVAAFFNAVKTPQLKEWPKNAQGKPDSVAAWRYMKDHFWDGVNFNDDRLVRTPFFDPKLEDYYKYYVMQDADSIIPEVNYMLLMSRTAKEMHKYLLGKFTDKYINPEIMGQDKVFIFLFENYFSKGDTLWLNAQQKKYIFDRAYSLMANQVNEQAAQLNLKDTAGKTVSLYNIQAPFTFVVFWDPTCGHCKTEVPMLDSMYEHKWKSLGVKIFAVNTNDGTYAEWLAFIKEHKLNGWYHCWQTKEGREAEEKKGVANFRQLYDVFQTPTMYLLDKDKRILAKKLSLEQYDGLIEKSIKQAKTK